jgi:diketogulonate reductase-like aldo/keto reductase
VLGIGGTYGRIDETQFQLAVRQAIEGGITCFDTAEAYGMGSLSEPGTGAAGAAGMSGRHQVRAGYADRSTRRDGSRRVVASIEKSLQALGHDYVDVYPLDW